MTFEIIVFEVIIFGIIAFEAIYIVDTYDRLAIIFKETDFSILGFDFGIKVRFTSYFSYIFFGFS
jgi:hypothetical protein